MELTPLLLVPRRARRHGFLYFIYQNISKIHQKKRKKEKTIKPKTYCNRRIGKCMRKSQRHMAIHTAPPPTFYMPQLKLSPKVSCFQQNKFFVSN